MGTVSSITESLSAKDLKIAVVASRYNESVCDGLLQGALSELERLHLAQENLAVFRVPGAFELPLFAQTLAETEKFDAIICLGVVIRGETAHFDYVCQGVTQGIMNAMQNTGIPMAFGVLTTDNEEQAKARAKADEHNKGLEAARTAVEMAHLRKKIIASI